MNKETLTTLLRALMKIGGGWLIANGYLDDDAMIELTGAVVTIAGVVWGVVDARKHKAVKVEVAAEKETVKKLKAQAPGDFSKPSQTNQ
jgi:hypothetical protein